MKTTQISSPWRTDAPPQDETPIIAIGKVIGEDNFSTTSEPFVDAITWGSTRFSDREAGWHFWRDGMSVKQSPDAAVVIHYWLPMPF